MVVHRLLTDERLARLAETGSDQALGVICVRYAAVLEGYCRSLVLDPDDARDATQNAMLKAMLAMRRGGRAAPLRPWLFRIAHNESMTILRQRARRPDALHEGVRSVDGDAHRHAVARERLGELLAQMQTLTSHQRGALVMRELGGMGYDEIAGALDTTPLAARQAVFAARRALGAPARRRSHLRALLPPVPLGAAALGAVLSSGGGGAGAATGGAVFSKIVATVAGVSIAIGSVEVVTAPSPSPRSASRERAAVAETPKRTPTKRPAAKRSAAKPRVASPKAVATAAPVKRVAYAAPAATESESAADGAARAQRQAVARERRQAAAERKPVARGDDRLDDASEQPIEEEGSPDRLAAFHPSRRDGDRRESFYGDDAHTAGAGDCPPDAQDASAEQPAPPAEQPPPPQ